MFRFTIRDVLWLTVVVAVGMAWWYQQRQVAARHAAELQKSAVRADFFLRTLGQYKVVVEELNGGFVAYPEPPATIMGRPEP